MLHTGRSGVAVLLPVRLLLHGAGGLPVVRRRLAGGPNIRRTTLPVLHGPGRLVRSAPLLGLLARRRSYWRRRRGGGLLLVRSRGCAAVRRVACWRGAAVRRWGRVRVASRWVLRSCGLRRAGRGLRWSRWRMVRVGPLKLLLLLLPRSRGQGGVPSLLPGRGRADAKRRRLLLLLRRSTRLLLPQRAGRRPPGQWRVAEWRDGTVRWDSGYRAPTQRRRRHRGAVVRWRRLRRWIAVRWWWRRRRRLGCSRVLLAAGVGPLIVGRLRWRMLLRRWRRRQRRLGC